MTSTEDSSPDITWQEAVARLAKERTLAESCAGLLKKVGDAAAVARGALAYADAKAEYDGIIAGLTVALAQKADPTSLPELQAMLAQGFAKRQAFCESVKALAPGPVAYPAENCTNCPVFSSSVICFRSASTRAFTASDASWALGAGLG